MNAVFWAVRASIAGRPGPQRVPWSLPAPSGTGLLTRDAIIDHRTDFTGRETRATQTAR